MKALLHFELGPLPYSLATVDGCSVKTAKSKLRLLLLEDCDDAVIPPNSAIVLDAMAVLQCMVPTGSTFESLASQVLHFVMHNVPEGGRIDFVCDQYPPSSIKTLEQEKRARSGSLAVVITGIQQRLPSWKKILAVSANKVAR